MASMAVFLLASARARSARGDDMDVAQALVQQLERDGASGLLSARARTRAAGSALAQALAAMERARRMRAVGDEVHARAADGLAREWAETARDVARAVDAEARAAERRRSAVESQAQLERTRALVEEGIAHVGRLRAELDKVQTSGRGPRTAVEVHDSQPTKTGAKPAKANAVHPAPSSGANGSAESTGTP
jgi:hypothetical protein